ACIEPAVLLYYVKKNLTEKKPDHTYRSAFKMIWSLVEINVGFIAVSIPSLRPLAKRYFPHFFEHSKPRPVKGSARLAPNVNCRLGFAPFGTSVGTAVGTAELSVAKTSSSLDASCQEVTGVSE